MGAGVLVLVVLTLVWCGVHRSSWISRCRQNIFPFATSLYYWDSRATNVLEQEYISVFYTLYMITRLFYTLL